MSYHNATTRKPRDADFYREIGRKGGAANKARGADFKALGARGGQKVKAMGVDYRAMGALGSAKRLSNARNAALEEAALAAQEVADTCALLVAQVMASPHASLEASHRGAGARSVVAAIRALKR